MPRNKRRTIKIPPEYTEKSITEAAAAIGTSKQNAQQIEIIALEKCLRAAKRAGLHDFLEP